MRTKAILKSSIVIATHNRRQDLCRTLGKLRSLEPKPFEILIVLDGCTDGSQEEVAARFPEATIVENPIKQGSVPSRDTAFRMAKGDLIVSLDDDSYPLQPDFIARVARLVADHPEAGIFAFREERSGWPEFHKGSRYEHTGHYVGAYANCAGAVLRSLYGDSISYPLFFRHMYEEPDSCLQAYSTGHAVWYEPSIIVFHHASPVERNVITRHHLHARNEFWSVILRCPFPHCLWVGAYRIVRQFIYSVSNGPGWVLNEPKWWASAASGFARCLRERKPVPWKIYWAWLRLARQPALSLVELKAKFGAEVFN